MRSSLQPRALAAARRAAEEAGFDDPSFDLDDVLGAAGLTYASVAAARTADELEDLFELSGAAYRESGQAFHVRLIRPALWMAALERGPDSRVVGATVVVEVWVEMWTGPLGFQLGRAAGVLLAFLLWDPSALTTFAETRRLRSYWAYVRDGGGWRFDHVEESWWAELRMQSDPSGEAARVDRLRQSSLLELSETGDASLPREIATNLPSDTNAAMQELALLDDRFAPAVVDAAVRLLHDRLDDRPGSRVTAVTVRRLYAERTPPEIDVEVRLRAAPIHWLHLAPGDWFKQLVEVRTWRLAATSSRGEPWRLLDPVADPSGD